METFLDSKAKMSRNHLLGKFYTLKVEQEVRRRELFSRMFNFDILGKMNERRVEEKLKLKL